MTNHNPRSLDEARLRPHLRRDQPRHIHPMPHIDTFNAAGTPKARATAVGEPGDLRGIPVVGARGVGGVSPGTQPSRRLISQHGDWSPPKKDQAA